MSTTLREKVGELFMLGFEGTTVTPELADLITQYRPGGFIVFRRNLESVDQIVSLTNTLQKLAPDLPFLLSIDQEGGRVSRLPAGFTVFPPCARLGQCRSSNLAYEVAATTAAELKAVGLNMNMAPVLDLHTNPKNPIIGDRAFGTTAADVCEFGLATMAGLQDHKVIACGKHFPGHGDTAADSHLELPVVSTSLEHLLEHETRPFRHAIENGLAAIMTAHVSYPALDARYPATLSATIVSDLLRSRLTFNGVIVTDDLEMRAIIDHYGIEEAAVLAFKAGADILLICKDQARAVAAMEAMYRAVKDGLIPERRVEQSVRRIRQLKERYLLPYAPVTAKQAKQIVGCARHHAVLEHVQTASDRLPKASV